MDLTQLAVTLVAVVGIALVAVLAIVPTLLELPVAVPVTHRRPVAPGARRRS